MLGRRGGGSASAPQARTYAASSSSSGSGSWYSSSSWIEDEDSPLSGLSTRRPGTGKLAAPAECRRAPRVISLLRSEDMESRRSRSETEREVEEPDARGARMRTSGTSSMPPARWERGRCLRGGEPAEDAGDDEGEKRERREEVRRAKLSPKEESISELRLEGVAEVTDEDAVGEGGADEQDEEAVTPEDAERWGDATKDSYAARFGSRTSARLRGGGAKE